MPPEERIVAFSAIPQQKCPVCGAVEHSLVSVAIAAKDVGVSTRTIERWIDDGTVLAFKAGRVIRVDLGTVHGRLRQIRSAADA
jgi:excisionase family DNA binding protein